MLAHRRAEHGRGAAGVAARGIAFGDRDPAVGRVELAHQGTARSGQRQRRARRGDMARGAGEARAALQRIAGRAEQQGRGGKLQHRAAQAKQAQRAERDRAEQRQGDPAAHRLSLAADDPRAGGEQQDRRGPQRPGQRLDRRLEADPVAVALDQPGADRRRIVARRDPLADQGAHVAGELGIRIGDRLALANQAAKLLHQARVAWASWRGSGSWRLAQRRRRQRLNRPSAGVRERSEQREEQQANSHRASSSSRDGSSAHRRGSIGPKCW